jgi:hypothetical protein
MRYCLPPFFLLFLSFSLQAFPADTSAPVFIGSRLELFADAAMIASLENLQHLPAVPVHRETVLSFDRPREGRYSGYVTVLQDGDSYRMYYRGSPVIGKDGSSSEVTCYAESKDGIHWKKPEDNIILSDQPPYSHNFSPFINTRPGAPLSERYLAVAGKEVSGLSSFSSSDGIDWVMKDEAIITDGKFDSQNLAFWSEAEQCYVCYFRTWSEGGYQGYRWVSRSTSPDFIHWSATEEMSAGDAPPEHIYTNQTFPYFRAPHIYIALAARFMPGRRIVSETEAKALGVEKGYFNDCSDNVLMTSRGGNRYDRCFMEGFVRPGIGLENWTSRTNYPAWGIVATSDTELSFYVQHNYGQPTARIDRYTLRTDGFASIRGDYQGGILTTVPLIFSGDDLYVNLSTSAAGSLRAALVDLEGKSFDGFSLEDCEEIFGNSIEKQLRWKEDRSCAPLAGQPLRILFEIRDGDLFAFQFK